MSKLLVHSLFAIVCILICPAIGTAKEIQIEAIAPRRLRVIIKEKSLSPEVPLFKVLSKVTRKHKAVFTITEGRARFADGSKKSVQYVTSNEAVMLPQIQPGKSFDEAKVEVKLTRKRLKQIIEIISNPGDTFQILSTSPEVYGAALYDLSESHAVIDLKKLRDISVPEEGSDSVVVPPSQQTIQRTLDGADSIFFDPEEGGGEILTRGLCTRPWDPSGYTRWGSGIVEWANNPAAAGFSIKDEHDKSGYASTLRFPKGPYKTEFSVDGVYRRSWAFVAYKVPNHCTASREKINGKWAFRCCCNVAATPLAGRCRLLNALEHSDWPNSPKSTCRDPR